jgi:hypothetical protein
MGGVRLGSAGGDRRLSGAPQPLDPDLAQSDKQPVGHGRVADKPGQGRTVIVQPSSVQHGPGMGKSPLLTEREGRQ